jgi:quercetin dioxygenase-like cupin family protein
MTHHELNTMIKGWFVGDFEPSAFRTNTCEVAVKRYAAGDFEAAHFHKIATEITLIVSGEVQMMDRTWKAGDIIVLNPGEVTAFKALTDTVNVVVKLPGANNDKYIA